VINFGYKLFSFLIKKMSKLTRYSSDLTSLTRLIIRLGLGSLADLSVSHPERSWWVASNIG